MSRQSANPFTSAFEADAEEFERKRMLSAYFRNPRTKTGQRISTLRLRGKRLWAAWTYFWLTIGLTLIGLGAIVLGWAPGSVDSSNVDILIAAATVLAFTSIVLTALTLPHSMAAALAPGYSAEVQSRRAPWVTGIAQVLLSAGLFALAASGPTRLVAVGGALCAVGGMSASWFISRLLMDSADPIALSQRQTLFIEKAFASAIRHNRASSARFLRRAGRTSSNIRMLSRDQDLAYLNGFIRHMRSGFSAALASGQPQLVPTYWQGMLNIFNQHSQDTRGRVGGFDGPIAHIASAAMELTQAALERKGEYESTAVYCLPLLSTLEIPEAEHPQFEQVSQRLLHLFQSALDDAWSHDWSQLPATIVNTIGDLYKNCLQNGALDAAAMWNEELRRRIVQARQTRQAPISNYGVRRYLSALPIILSLKGSQRKGALSDFLLLLPELRHTPQGGSRTSLSDSLELMVPGVNYEGAGLQEVICQTEFSGESFLLLELALQEVLLSCFVENSNLPEDWRDSVADALSLLHCLSMRGAEFGISMQGFWNFADQLRACGGACGLSPLDTLLEPDVGELMWSIAAVQCAVTDDKDRFVLFCNDTFSAVGELKRLPKKIDKYQHLLMRGVILCAGISPKTAKARLAHFEVRYGTEHIEPIGSIPSVNRNRAMHNPAVVVAANSWLATNFEVGPESAR